jgi:hypothetical protein
LQDTIPILFVLVAQSLLEEGRVLGGIMFQILVLSGEQISNPSFLGIRDLRRPNGNQADEHDGRPRYMHIV